MPRDPPWRQGGPYLAVATASRAPGGFRHFFGCRMDRRTRGRRHCLLHRQELISKKKFTDTDTDSEDTDTDEEDKVATTRGFQEAVAIANVISTSGQFPDHDSQDPPSFLPRPHTTVRRRRRPPWGRPNAAQNSELVPCQSPYPRQSLPSLHIAAISTQTPDDSFFEPAFGQLPKPGPSNTRASLAPHIGRTLARLLLARPVRGNRGFPLGRNYSKRVAVIAVLPRMRPNVAVTAPRARSRLRPRAMK